MPLSCCHDTCVCVFVVDVAVFFLLQLYSFEAASAFDQDAEFAAQVASQGHRHSQHQHLHHSSSSSYSGGSNGGAGGGSSSSSSGSSSAGPKAGPPVVRQSRHVAWIKLV